MMVFDKDKDHRVTMEEVESTMHVLRMILNEGDGEGGSHYLAMLDGAQVAAPTIFAVLDSDQTGSLKSSELKWMTKFQKALKSGAMRNLTRSCFAALDVGPTDDKVSAAELEVAAQQDSPVLMPSTAASGNPNNMHICMQIQIASNLHIAFIY